MDWDLAVLEALKASRTAWDEPADWRVALALYDRLSPADAAALDRTILAMIDVGYRNPHASSEPMPFDDLMVNLPEGLGLEDLLCIEAAVLVASERGLSEAFFAFNRLMGLPVWHALSGRLQWLTREGFAAQRKLALTRGGRGQGALLGLAAGDALGCTLEFLSRQEVRDRSPGGHREISGGGAFHTPPGGWTDDTEMTLAVAGGIIESPADPVDAVGRRFMEWYRSNPPDVGNTCRLALSAYSRAGSWAAASREVERTMGVGAGGNGALMRTLPTALAYGASTGEAVEIGRMTHPHPESDGAVVAYHRMADALLNGASKEQALQAGLSGAGPLAERLAAVIGRPEATVVSSGYVVHTLEAAIWSFFGTNSLEDCIVAAVNLGDDADTVGAVAGGLAGAHYGPLAVPRRWSLAIAGRRVLEEAAEGLYHVWVRRNS